MSNEQTQPIDDAAAIDSGETPIESSSAIYSFGDEGAEETETTPVKDNVLDTPTVEAADVKIEATEEEKPEEPEAHAPAPTHKNVELIYEVYTDVDKKIGSTPLVFVPKRTRRLDDRIRTWSIDRNQEEDTGIAKHLGMWFYGLEQMMSESYIEGKGTFETALDNEESKWEQEHLHEGTRIGIRRPTFNDPDKARRLTGAAARDRISSLLGIGLSNRIPLPHTGLNITLGARGEIDYLNLDVLLSVDKAKAGFDSVGMIFQNSHYGLIEHVFNFIKDSVVDINLLNWRDHDLGDVIRITDLPILEWGMGATMYPNGYPIDLPCSNGPANCNHVETVNLNIHRLFWLNANGLSLSQKNVLTSVKHKHTIEQVDEYQKTGVSPFTKTVSISNDIELVLKVPTINEHLKAGREWVEEASQAFDKILNTEQQEQMTRRKYIDSILTLSTLREYSHWIDKIIIRKLDEITDFDTINQTLVTMSTADDLVTVAFEKIQRFIEEVTVAVIAIPNFACPACGFDHMTDENSRHPELAPIDPLKLFFELKDRRLQRRS